MAAAPVEVAEGVEAAVAFPVVVAVVPAATRAAVVAALVAAALMASGAKAVEAPLGRDVTRRRYAKDFFPKVDFSPP